MSCFGTLISTHLIVWFHLISDTSLTGEWSMSNAAILVFKTPKWCDKWNACEWRPHTCKLLFLDSLQHSAGRNASITPWHPLSARICNCKDGAEEAVGDDASTRFPALQTSGSSEIKMEWIADDKSRRPDVVVLWLLTGVNQDWVVLQHLSMPSVSSCKGLLSPTSSNCRRRTHYFAIDARCILQARAKALILIP